MTEVRKFMDCSTAHLSPEARTALDSSDGTLGTVYPTPYGWFVYVADTDASGVCAALALTFAKARDLGCDYIMFDQDAPEHDELQRFDW